MLPIEIGLKEERRLHDLAAPTNAANAGEPRSYLGSRTGGRDNNFNLIRLIAAASVLLSHAYPIALGSGAVEPLQGVLQGYSLGGVAVIIFFGISGFLIAKSYDRTASLSRFVVARILRLFPALIVVLLITLIVSALWLTTADSGTFARAAPSYFFRNVTLYALQYELPGVFTGNPFPKTINGSLWTLNHEVSCYVSVFALGVLGFLANRARMSAALVLFIAAYSINAYAPLHPRLEALFELAWPFWVGIALYVWRDQVELSTRLAGVLVAATVLSSFTPLFHEILMITIVYLTFLLAFWRSETLLKFNRIGDYSYGVYIYAFPVQQLCASLFPGMTPLQNIALALPATLFCGAMSWMLVERHALALMKK